MKSIVVVDDQHDMLILIKSILTRQGYQVHTDATGEIFNKSAIEDCDLILLDINLGEKDGRDLCKRHKDESKTRHIPVILVSSIPELSSAYKTCGADEYLKKPFSSTELIKKVDHFLKAA
jgi:DNA-binding response OmpR family regulator